MLRLLLVALALASVCFTYAIDAASECARNDVTESSDISCESSAGNELKRLQGYSDANRKDPDGDAIRQTQRRVSTDAIPLSENSTGIFKELYQIQQRLNENVRREKE